jgi:extracellular elastinolytic metalloproteinase
LIPQVILDPFVFLILAINMRSFLLASLASLATIRSTQGHPALHSNRGISRRAIDLDSFRMKVPVAYTNATAVVADPSIPTLARRSTAEDTATELVKQIAPRATFRLVDNYVGTNGIAHFYFKQTANGLDVDNGDFNVNVSHHDQRELLIHSRTTLLPLTCSRVHITDYNQVGRDGMVFSFGNSFFKGDIPAAPSKSKRDTIEPVAALHSAVSVLDLPVSAASATAEAKQDANTFAIKQTSGTVSEPEARLVYVQTAEGKLALTWRVETDIMSNWLLTYVDAVDGSQVHAVVDYSADASYEV